MKPLLLILILIISGCTTQKRCARRFKPVSSIDSVYIEKVRNVPVYVPGDSLFIEIPIDCPDMDTVTVETGKLKQEISILKGRLRSVTTLKADTVFIPVKDIRVSLKEVIVQQPVKFIPKWAKVLMYIGGGSVLLLLLDIFVYRKVIKNRVFS